MEPTPKQLEQIFINSLKPLEEGIKEGRRKADFNEPIFLLLIIKTAIAEWEKIRGK